MLGEKRGGFFQQLCYKGRPDPFGSMKQRFLPTIAALFCSVSAASVSLAQTAVFSFDNGTGTPNSGTYNAGSSFSFAMNLQFAPGGSVQNLDGFSYWFQQTSPAGGTF